MSSIINTQINKKGLCRRYFFQICILISLIIIISIFFMKNLSIFNHLFKKSKPSEVSTISTSDIDIILPRKSMNYIYIDIGCFNGETIEHFLHFTPDSQNYTIITFEPDPHNYQLCKQRLTQKKYSNINIIILQKVVWIRDEKVYFRANRGRYSRITTNKIHNTTKHHPIQLDAIDFSSWLARLAKPKHTNITIKMSTPGAEISVLEKMVQDQTLALADKYEVEWSDRKNPHNAATRIYIQLMFDNRGFDCLYYTRLEDSRDSYQTKGTFKNMQKYYDWRLINSTETYAHYTQRPEVVQPLYQLKQMKKF